MGVGILAVAMYAVVAHARTERRALRERLEELAAVQAPSGDRIGSIRSGILEAGEDRRVRAHLHAGRCYVFIAVTSPDVTGLRAVVEAAGRVLGEDAGPDDSAVVRVCPTESAATRMILRAARGRGAYAAAVYEVARAAELPPTAASPDAAPSDGAGSTARDAPARPAAPRAAAAPDLWVVADAQVEAIAGLALGFQSPIADLVSSTAARPPAQVLGTEAILRRVAWYVRDNPAPLVFLGDAGQVGCRQEVEAVFRWFGLLETPWVFVPGNHDCFPLGALAPDAAASIGEAALTTLQRPETWLELPSSPEEFVSRALDPSTIGDQWAAACADTSDAGAGVANKHWLVERVVRQFEDARSRAPSRDRRYWRQEHLIGPAPGDGGGASLQHWTSWVVQVFPLGASAAGDAPGALALAIDTTDWSDPGALVGLSPGTQGCLSAAQVEAAERLVRQVRAVAPGLPVVVFGHHPTDVLYGNCALTFGRLMSSLGAATYVAAHTHRAAPARAIDVLVDILPGSRHAVTEHVVGSVVEYGGADAEPGIERFRIGAGGRVEREFLPVAAIAAAGSAAAPPLDCASVWSLPATPPETRAYQEALLVGDARSRWLMLGLDHVRRVGEWCASAGGGSRCNVPRGRCARSYEDAARLLRRGPISSRLAFLGGAAPVPGVLRCTRSALGLLDTQPEHVDADRERYVFCTALRAAAQEAGAEVGRSPAAPPGGSTE